MMLVCRENFSPEIGSIKKRCDASLEIVRSTTGVNSIREQKR